MIKGYLKTIVTSLLILVCFSLLSPLPVVGSNSSSEVEELTIGKTIPLALSNRTEVNQAKLRLERAELQLKAAKEETTFPSVQINLDSPRWTSDGLTGGITGSAEATLSTNLGTKSSISANLTGSWYTDGELDYSWGLNLSQNLDFSESNSVQEGLEERRKSVREARSNLEEVKQSTVLTTIEKYTQLVQEKRELNQAEADLEDAQENLEKVKGLVEKGVKGETALMEARVKLLDSRIEVDKKSSSFSSDKESFGRTFLDTEKGFKVISPEFPLEELKPRTSSLLEKDELVEQALEKSSEIEQAREEVEEAEENLRKKKREVFPAFSLEAGVGSDGISAGFSISFDLFSPSHTEEVEIAKKDLSLTQRNLKATKHTVREKILGARTSLKEALNNLKKLSTEREKWNLEEKVKKEKYEAGALSDNDWEEFQEELEQFRIEAQSRRTELLQAYLKYRKRLGLELNWKEWLE